MDYRDAIRSILDDPKFDSILQAKHDIQQEWAEQGLKEQGKYDDAAMNAIKYSSRIQGLEDFIERLGQLAVKPLKDKINKDNESKTQ